MKLVLGSGSAYRKKALTEMGYDFDVITADIDEKAIRDPNPDILTLKLAKAKAEAIIPKLTEPVILITSDQVIVWNNTIREKPIDESEARYFLESYADYPAEAVSAIIVTDTATGRQVEGVDRAKIYFKPIVRDVIDQLVANPKTYSRAGGFGAEDQILQPYIDRVEGSVDCIGGFPKRLGQELIDSMMKGSE